MDACAKLGVDAVLLMPSGDPVAYVERAGSEIVSRLAELGTGG